jgi:hypothetical protein
MKKLGLLLLLAGAFTLFNNFNQPPKWENLGSRTVNWSADHDIIPVTAAKGNFKSIKLFVDKAPVSFGNVKIHFANGGVQDVAIKNRIPAGGETRVIDIVGKDRVIKKVTFWYTTSKPAPKGRAIVTLYGRK